MFHPNRPARRGVAATEFAVCLPVLMLLLLGTIECCSMIFLKQTLAVAAYEGGHAALAPGATSAQARVAAEAILTERRIAGGSVEIAPRPLESIAEGEFFDIRVSAPTNANRILPLNFFGGRTLTATASFMRENL
ncbi:TadE/TadG family type IV pilus assembly protein [Botrimarina mediterranea]|uniref:TadE-like protein n=1 Tax=Botrimarina mediterranea TaxID=2528022 RepID=A0A518KB30_9BACT|nr:TadE/TadG family type IV pilus assembly protein [Botrimarina mediterranea]QDV74997.1 TadE-like protein [Botrimarina mediterranea]QDV79644.1 TadE-like protein [Planctomycetes bacterium K2D]